MAYTKTNWQDLPNTTTPINATNLNKMEDGIANAVEKVSSVEYASWHSVVLTRSDTNMIYIMLYGANILKEGTYSIDNNFTIYTYGTTNSTLTIPTTAISNILRFNWGFELQINRSGITGITSGQYNGIAIPGGSSILLKST